MEETGWTIAYPKRLGAYRRFVFMPEYNLLAEKVCTVYVAWPVLKKCDPLEADHTAIWASPEAAVDLLRDAGSNHFVRKFLR